jgi:hypothetical protein
MLIKRVLTGMAVAVGILGFVSIVGNWTSAIDAEFLVYGQSEGGRTGGGGSTVTQIIPHVAAGSFAGSTDTFSTIIQIINGGASAVTLTSIELFNQDGSPSTVPFSTTSFTAPVFTGSLNNLTLPANDSIVLTSGNTSTGVVNWARIVSEGNVHVLGVFELRTATGALVSRVGVPATVGTASKLIIPRMRNVTQNLATAFALANASDAEVTITATLYSEATAIGSNTLVLGAGNQTAKFAWEFFSLTNEASDTNFSHMVLESTAGGLSATALVFEGGNQATFPVGQIQ